MSVVGLLNSIKINGVPLYEKRTMLKPLTEDELRLLAAIREGDSNNMLLWLVLADAVEEAGKPELALYIRFWAEICECKCDKGGSHAMTVSNPNDKCDVCTEKLGRAKAIRPDIEAQIAQIREHT